LLKNILGRLKGPEDYGIFGRYVAQLDEVETFVRNEQARKLAPVKEQLEKRLDELVRQGANTKDPQQLEAISREYDAIREQLRGIPREVYTELGSTPEKAVEELQRLQTVIAQYPHIEETYRDFRKLVDFIGDELVNRGLLPAEHRQHYFHHYVLDYLDAEHLKNLPRGVGLSRRLSPSLKTRLGTGRFHSRDIITVMGNYVQTHLEMFAKHDLVNSIAKREHITMRPGAVPEEVLQAYKEHRVIPQGWTLYGLDSGITRTRGSSFAERLFETLTDLAPVDEMAQKLHVPLQELLDRLPYLRESTVPRELINDVDPTKGKFVVIPNEVAHELKLMLQQEADHPLIAGVNKFSRWWKTIAIHLKPVRYNITNLGGDLVRYTMQFGHHMLNGDLWNEAAEHVIQARLGKLSPEWRYAQRRGVLSSGRLAVEAKQYWATPQFQRLLENPAPLRFENAKQVLKWLGPFPAQMREDISRMYVFLLNARRKPGDLLVGAVDSEYIKGLLEQEGHMAAAAAIARRAGIDYGDFTPEEDIIRNSVAFFYAWLKGNLLFWGRDYPVALGRSIKNLVRGSATSSDEAMLTGAALLATGLTGLWIWNNQNAEFTKASESLPTYMHGRRFVLLPDIKAYKETGELKPMKDKNGKYVTISIADGLTDFLEATGAEALLPAVKALSDGRISLDEFTKMAADEFTGEGTVPFAPAIEFGYRQLSPYFHMPMAAAGIKDFPSVLHAQKIPTELSRIPRVLGTAVPGFEHPFKDIEEGAPLSSTKKFFLDIPSQLGIQSHEPLPLRSFAHKLLTRIQSEKATIEDLKSRYRRVASKQAEPNLEPEERERRLDLIRTQMQVHANRLQKLAQRYQAIKQTP